ncbi:fucolectin-1-like [Scomber japonicus]|uniref:fucolectin-1-like n=1 Tax=Scomber japonicus TaxID=13676 RepID=UPI00230623D5|nr:fucolectin-1-like [Scomber japonicus]
MKTSSLLPLLVFMGTCSANHYENVALRGTATQSQRLRGKNDVFGAAYNAIDGNRDARFTSGSCTHTAQMTNPWWRVDMLNPYMVTTIIITNRGDCCANRINGAEVYVTKTLHSISYSAYESHSIPAVAVISHIPAGRPHIINLKNPVEGRFVTVSLPGYGRILSLCEVEVYGYPAPTGFNLAVLGKASQSSLYSYQCDAYHAIDGHHSTTWAEGSCSCTKSSHSPWWQLDLGKTHKVNTVKITNTKTYPTYLDGAEIRIGKSSAKTGTNNPRCTVISHIPAGFTQTFDCKGMDGRYVTIVAPGKTIYLTLCEVEVYGSVLD